METIFNQENRTTLIERIKLLNDTSSRHWGKMTGYQVVKHCVLSEEMYLRKTDYKRLFIGKLFGKMALKGILKNNNPMKKNQPTHETFKIIGTGNIEPEKLRWIELLCEYEGKKDSFFDGFVHPFFGKMNKKQIGIYVFKHTDHHLRQFGI